MRRTNQAALCGVKRGVKDKENDPKGLQGFCVASR